MKLNFNKSPLEQFIYFYNEVTKVTSDRVLSNSFQLSTSSKEGIVSSRTVMLRSFDEEGFKFYTNYNSRKGQDIEENPNVSFVKYWHENKTQVSMRGVCKKLSKEESDEYYSKLSRISQIIPYVSKQSQDLESPEKYSELISQFTKENDGKDLKRPEYWGGYVIIPSYFEFWRELQPNEFEKLSSGSIRVKYTFDTKTQEWKMNYLFP